MIEMNEMTSMDETNAAEQSAEQRRLALLQGETVSTEAEPAVVEESVLSPKALDELREILRSDENVREFFLLLKNRELRQEAIARLNSHLAK